MRFVVGRLQQAQMPERRRLEAQRTMHQVMLHQMPRDAFEMDRQVGLFGRMNHNYSIACAARRLRFWSRLATGMIAIRFRKMPAMKYLFLAVLILSGCAAWHWEKRGSSATDYELDEKYCKLQAYSGTDGMVTKAGVRRMHECMEGKGWKKVAN